MRSRLRGTRSRATANRRVPPDPLSAAGGTLRGVTPAQPVDLAEALSRFAEPWQPRTVAVLNDYDLRVVKMRGEFTRHRHPETDEVFLVLRGSLTIRLDHEEIRLLPGQLYVVPRGTQHQPVAPDGAEVLLIEPSATVNTGDNPGALTAERRAG